MWSLSCRVELNLAPHTAQLCPEAAASAECCEEVCARSCAARRKAWTNQR